MNQGRLSKLSQFSSARKTHQKAALSINEASSSAYTPDRRISTKYSTFLDGQMLQAKPRIDNYSQVEPFFDTLADKNIFKGSPHKYKKIEKGSKKKLAGSPYGLRDSLMTLEKLD